MKAGIFAIAAAIVSGVGASHHAGRRHNHEAFHLERGLSSNLTSASVEPTCGCTTIYYTWTGEAIWPTQETTYAAPATTLSTTPAAISTSTSTPPPPPPPSSTTTILSTIWATTPPVVPTPFVTTCPTPGTYTIPATTITVTEETTVCAATSTPISSGTYTAGGVVTVVTTETTVVCPYATTTTSGSVVTTTLLTTTYVCPSAGTYTIAPLTTTVSESTIWVYPIPTSYPAGTYTQTETVVTVTETDFVYFCPFATSIPAPAPTYAPAPAPSSAAPVVASPSPSSSSSGSGNGGSIGGSGNQWAITYTPYTAQGTCKDQGSVNDDIESIRNRGFSAVRVYSTDCSTLDFVGSACATYNLKMILGIFISDTGCSGAQEQVDAITSWAQWSLVELIVVGNEAIMNNYASAGELAGFVSSSASAFKSAGYTGQITTTEPLDIWQANSGALCGVVDVVGCNIHPFFNPNTAAGDAGTFVSGQLELVDGLCPGKTGINLETGWPSNGDGCNGAACPGALEQVTAVGAITSAAGSRSVMFSFENDPWKGAGAFGCEPYWGSITLFDVLEEFLNIDIPIKE